jgi:hypothetical protein
VFEHNREPHQITPTPWWINLNQSAGALPICGNYGLDHTDAVHMVHGAHAPV